MDQDFVRFLSVFERENAPFSLIEADRARTTRRDLNVTDLAICKEIHGGAGENRTPV
jgi:hypothetical protein